MKKKWIAGVAAAAVLGVAATSGAMYAQSSSTSTGTTTTPPPAASAQTAPQAQLKAFEGRVASILGLSTSTVENAFQQAMTEQANSALQQRLNAAVQAGKLTQAQANQIQQWFDSRPSDIPLPGLMPYLGGRGGPGGFGHFGRFGHGHFEGPRAFGFGPGWGGQAGGSSATPPATTPTPSGSANG